MEPLGKALEGLDSNVAFIKNILDTEQLKSQDCPLELLQVNILYEPRP